MFDSRPPRSSQEQIHPRLAEVVGRHLENVWRQPLRAHSRAAFDRLLHELPDDRDLIIDAGCGTGRSTALLASRFPDCLVIGVDRSSHRLARAPELPDNARLVRADLSDFWRLARAAGWRLRRHYLLYPNPWPKPGHLQRRWHAHAVWPDLLALGGLLEMRTNFRIFAEEFAAALNIAGHAADMQMLSFGVEQALSPFERKYARSGHDLFRVCADLSGASQSR